MARSIIWRNGVKLFIDAADIPVPAAVTDRDLMQEEFMALLGYTGLDAVWGLLLGSLEGASDSASRATRAALKANLHRGKYRLTETLALVGQFRDAAQALDPDADLTDAGITAAWAWVVNNPL